MSVPLPTKFIIHIDVCNILEKIVDQMTILIMTVYKSYEIVIILKSYILPWISKT